MCDIFLHTPRYSWGGEPLFITCPPSDISRGVPACSNCGSNRVFEFQLMPALVSMLESDAGANFYYLFLYEALCYNCIERDIGTWVTSGMANLQHEWHRQPLWIAHSRSGREQKAEQQLRQKKGIGMALQEGSGLIYGMTAKKDGPQWVTSCKI